MFLGNRCGFYSERDVYRTSDRSCHCMHIKLFGSYHDRIDEAILGYYLHAYMYGEIKDQQVNKKHSL